MNGVHLLGEAHMPWNILIDTHRHFECVIRSKELEVLLSRARAAEQKQLAEGEKARFERQEEEACCCSHQCTASLTISGVLEHSAAEGPRGCSERADDAH